MATQFSGGTYVSATFTGDTRANIMSNLKTQLVTAGWTNKAYMGGGIGIVGTFTVTIATPGVVTFSTHGLSNNDVVILQTTGALPTGLSVNTRYFARNVSTNTFELSTTSGGSSIATSGSQSGTHTLNSEAMLFESATQANVTNPIHLRLKDNRGNCVQVSIENQAGSVVGGNSTSAGGNLLPAAAKTWRIIATQYHFLCFTPGASGAREFVMAGMLYVPSFLTSVTDHGYMFCNSWSDTSTGVQPCFRYSPSMIVGGSAQGVTFNTSTNLQVIWNANILETTNTNNFSPGWYSGGVPEAIVTVQTTITGTSSSIVFRGYRWANDDINTSDVLCCAGLTSTTDEGKIKGQFFDLIYIADAFAVDATDTFNSHTWYNLTNNNVGVSGQVPRGGIWCATS